MRFQREYRGGEEKKGFNKECWGFLVLFKFRQNKKFGKEIKEEQAEVGELREMVL